MKKFFLASVWGILTFFFCGCTKQVPQNYTKTDQLPAIYPEYTQVTIPCNIAPLHFTIEESADEYICRLSFPGGEWVGSGRHVLPEIKEWRNILHAAKGKRICIEVFTKNKGTWNRFKPFYFQVSKDEIDSYLSYRLIAPSYVTYEALTINQRNLTNYDESVIYSNMLLAKEKDGQCINCHAYQNYNPERMQFHARQSYGGTIIAYDGKLSKIDLKTDSTISGGVYPAWHPTARLIAYSTNNTGQSFHTRSLRKVEVIDSESDLVLYDIDQNKISYIAREPNELEVFPSWSPDGNYLYYCSAHFEFQDTTNKEFQVIQRYKDVKYNIYRKRFDPKNLTFGCKELVYDAASKGKSATLPRVSPDGNYLLFTLAEYGVFHIWHTDADFYLTDLRTLHTRSLKEINSQDVESYHSWSSNGRWIVFSSRRNDGNFTRPFIAYMGPDGKAGKPFELPQEDPEMHKEFLLSYNIPEFMKGPVKIHPREFAQTFKGKSKKTNYSNQTN